MITVEWALLTHWKVVSLQVLWEPPSQRRCGAAANKSWFGARTNHWIPAKVELFLAEQSQVQYLQYLQYNHHPYHYIHEHHHHHGHHHHHSHDHHIWFHHNINYDHKATITTKLKKQQCWVLTMLRKVRLDVANAGQGADYSPNIEWSTRVEARTRTRCQLWLQTCLLMGYAKG